MSTEQAVPTCYRHPDRVTGLSCSECERPICAECSQDAAVGQRCPVCAGPANRTRVVRSRDLQASGWRQTPASYGIIAIAAAIFVVTFPDSVRADVFRDFAQINLAVKDGEWWRVFTAGFLHDGFLHIGFNMYAVYLFGPRLEREAGSVPFAMLYFASMAAGGAAFLAFGGDITGGGFATVAVGASGAVFGLFGVWLAATYRIRHTPYGQAMFRQLVVLLAINAALPFIGSLNIAWEAHAGGLVVGAAMGYLWSTFAAGKPNAAQIRTSIAASFLVAAMVAVFLL